MSICFKNLFNTIQSAYAAIAPEIEGLDEWRNETIGTEEYANRIVAVERIREISQRNGLWLDLNGLKLSSLPPMLFRIKSLRVLLANDNMLTALPKEISNLENLEHLYLRDNLLTSFPSTMGSLKRLLTLDLDKNELEALGPEIGELEGLSTLSLQRNMLKNISPEIGRLKCLENLDLSDNYLETLPDELGYLGNIKKILEISGNQFEQIPSSLASLPKTCKINANLNPLSDEELEKFKKTVQEIKRANPSLGPSLESSY